MSRQLSISETGLKLIKAFEGFRPVDRLLVTGVRIVGYGHRLYSDRPVTMSRDEADKTLREDLAPFEELVNEEVLAPLTQSQFDALCSLAFNIGPKAFRGSDIVRALNNGRPLDAANGFDVWRTATIDGRTYVVDALLRRRTAEKSLFLRAENLPSAPTALVSPQQDANFPHVDIGDGVPVYTHADPSGVSETLPYEDDRHDDRDDIDPEPLAPIEPDGTVTLEEVLDLTGDANGPPAEHEPAEDLVGADTGEFQGDDDDDMIVTLNAGRDDTGAARTPADFVTQYRTDNPAQPDYRPSAIAQAADELRERLDNLIDNDPQQTSNVSQHSSERRDWPDSLMTRGEGAHPPAQQEIPGEPLDFVSPQTSDNPQRSNLVAFPSRTRQMDLPDTDTSDEELDQPVSYADGEVFEGEADILIDELDADDRLRGSAPSHDDYPDFSARVTQPSDIVYRPEGDDYIDDTSSRSSAGLWVLVVLGFGLLGGSIAAAMRGSVDLFGEWGPIAVVAGIITGILMVIFAIYISLTQKS